jgi:large subunit ribosomal protein L30
MKELVSEMFAVIRIRSSIGLRRDIEDTLKMLRLNAANNCVLVPDTESYRGMLEKVRDVVAYGIIDFDTLLTMIKKRGRLVGDERLTEENVKELGFNSIEEMGKAIFEEKIKMKDIPKLKPLFRLTPPSKGYKSVKEYYPKGSLGYLGNDINDLLKRMI